MDVFRVYFIVFEIYFNVFQCIYSIFQYIWMYLNVFAYFSRYINICTNIVIGISPSHSFLPRAPTYTFVFQYPQWLPSQHALLLYHFLPFPLIGSNFHPIYEIFVYQFLLFTFILNTTLYIPCYHCLHKA